MASDVESQESEAASTIAGELDEFTTDFWRGGAKGQLVLSACASCQRFVHPKGPLCPYCYARDLVPRAVSGEALLYAWTVNRHPWPSGPRSPYVPAVVELPEQDDLFLLTAIREEPDDERFVLGAPVRVAFERLDDDHFLPVFRFATEAGAQR